MARTPPAVLKQRARDRLALVRIQLRILHTACLYGPTGQEHLEEATQRRLANLESERRSLKT